MRGLIAIEGGSVRAGERVAEVVRRARTGDEAAFSQLFERYSRPVLAFLQGMVGHRDMAEEMMQETFARAFTLISRLRDEAKFSTWLFGIAKNVARESSRENTHKLDTTGLDDPSVNELADPFVNPERDLLSFQLHAAINAGLASLDADRRMALSLRVFADKSYQEIAEITGWSLAKVKTEIHRARLEMREWLKAYL